MTDRELRTELQHLVRRTSANLILGRLLTFCLVNALLYVLLLLLVVAFSLPLLLLNLICFTSLALFPGFLLLPLPPGRLKLFIRRLDKHCLLESYLEAPPQVRRYMLPELRRLLSVLSGKSILPLRLSRLHRGLLTALLACLICYQFGVFMRFDSFAWNFSARELVTRSFDMERGGGAEPAREAVEKGGKAPGSELTLPADEAKPAGQREEAEPALDLTALPEGGTVEMRGARETGGAREGGPESGEPAEEGQRRLSDGRDVPGAAGRGSESEETASGETGRGLQQAGSAGRGFLPSPLEEYRAALRELAARGGSELTAGSLSEALETGAWPPGLFRDYSGSRLPLSVLDPLLARIQADYLRLHDERF